MSKEEIEKAKRYFKYLIEMAHKEIENHKNDEFKGYGTLEDIAKLKYCNLKAIDDYIYQLEQENSKKDKTINEMVETLVGLTVWDSEKDEPFILGDKEEVKQYFEKKVEEEANGRMGKEKNRRLYI